MNINLNNPSSISFNTLKLFSHIHNVSECIIFPNNSYLFREFHEEEPQVYIFNWLCELYKILNDGASPFRTISIPGVGKTHDCDLARATVNFSDFCPISSLHKSLGFYSKIWLEEAIDMREDGVVYGVVYGDSDEVGDFPEKYIKNVAKNILIRMFLYNMFSSSSIYMTTPFIKFFRTADITLKDIIECAEKFDDTKKFGCADFLKNFKDF